MLLSKSLEHKNVPLENKCIFLIIIYSMVSQAFQNIDRQFSDVFHLVEMTLKTRKFDKIWHTRNLESTCGE